MPEPGAAGFACVWEFRVQPASQDAFEAAYGPGGEWARLFARDPQYLGTWLLRDAQEAGRYLTVDHWRSRDARDAFLGRHRSDYDALDARCEALTVSERALGDYELEGDVTGLPPGQD